MKAPPSKGTGPRNCRGGARARRTGTPYYARRAADQLEMAEADLEAAKEALKRGDEEEWNEAHPDPWGRALGRTAVHLG